MRILLIAPHQDDEILAAGGLIQKCIKHGDDFLVLFATMVIIMDLILQKSVTMKANKH